MNLDEKQTGFYLAYLKYKKENHLDVLKDKLFRVLLIVKELKSYIWVY